MTALIEGMSRILPLLIGASIKGSCVFLIVLGITAILKDARPSTRHLLWLIAIAGFPVGAAVAVCIPPIHLPLFQQGNPAGISAPAFLGDVWSLSGHASETSVPALSGIGQTDLPAADWRFWPVMAWLLGASLAMLRMAAAKSYLRGLARGAGTGGKSDRAAAGRELQSTADCIRNGFAIRRNVRLLETDMCCVPITFGTLIPKIVLPAHCQSMPRDSLGMILAHELAHVKRWDVLTYGAAYAACSLFWFIPFTWLALARLKIEQEKSCDEAVLSLSPRRADYAELLLGWSCRAPLPMSVAGLSMRNAAGKAIEERIAHVLRMTVEVGKRKSPPAAAVCLAGFLIVTFLSLVRCAPDNGQKALTGTETAARTAGEALSGEENIPRAWPLKGVRGTITQKFGDSTDPFTGEYKFHNGVDIAAVSGTPIVATAGGRVIQTGVSTDYGNFVFIDHGNGFETRYTKLREYTVKTGDSVIGGQVIGYLGNTGLSTGPHLHYEILEDGGNVDPLEKAADTGTTAGGTASRLGFIH